MSIGPHRGSPERLIFFSCIALAIVAVYVFPIIATARLTGTMNVPPLFAPDLSLYLNLSNIHFAVDGEPINPYFGNTSQFAPFSYVSFRLAFQTFGVLEKLLGGNLWTTVAAWDVICWLAICCGCFWFFEEMFPKLAMPFHALGVGLLMLVNFSALKSLAMAELGMSSADGLENFGLPYVRAFFPQVAIACLLPYLALQMRALKHWQWTTWASMLALQAVAFAMFPFSAVIMTGATLAAVLALLCTHGQLPNWKSVAIFVLLCGATDLAYCLRHWPDRAAHWATSLTEFHPQAIIAALTDARVMLLAVLTLLTALLARAVPREAKWTVVGVGVCCAALMFGDVVFAPAAFQVSYHAAYFLHFAIAIEIAFLAAAFGVHFAKSSRWARWAAAIMAAVLLANGGLLALTTYRSSLPLNREIADLAKALKIIKPVAGDLVIARADIDGPCAWIPLFTSATVLFCRNAEAALTTVQKHTVFRMREALYLYFAQHDAHWLEGLLAAGKSDDVANLGFIGETATVDESVRRQSIASIRAELVPLLSDVEAHTADLHRFFLTYNRVLVIDRAKQPQFSRGNLAEYLTIGPESRIGSFLFYWGEPF